MGFTNIGTYDCGTWHRALVPEPDDPLTHYWLKYVAENVARLTHPLAWTRSISHPLVDSLGFDLATMPCENFPFAKAWIRTPNDYWTDKFSVGAGNSMEAVGSVTNFDLRFTSAGSAHATLATMSMLSGFGGDVGTLLGAFIFWGK